MSIDNYRAECLKRLRILNLAEYATKAEIEKAHKKLARKWHPDKWANKSLKEREVANKKMQEVNEAYTFLTEDNANGFQDKCDCCGITYSFNKKFKDYKAGKGEYYHFCSERCFNRFNICVNCGTIKRLSLEEEKNNRSWAELGWGKAEEGVFCSLACYRELKQKNLANAPNCHYCSEKLGMNEAGKYCAYVPWDGDEMFCSKKCLSEWREKNNRGIFGKNHTKKQTSTDTNDNKRERETGDVKSNEKESSSPQEYFQEIAKLTLAQAKIKAKEEIEKLLKVHSLSAKNLNKKNWQGQASWEKYLESLDSSQAVSSFALKVYQDILEKSADKHNKNSSLFQKIKNSGWTLPITFILILTFLTWLILIIRKMRKSFLRIRNKK